MDQKDESPFASDDETMAYLKQVGSEIFRVEIPFEPDQYTYLVTIDDVAARVFADTVRASVDVIRGVPGVSGVVHQDRELIGVLGTAGASEIERALTELWQPVLERNGLA